MPIPEQSMKKPRKAPDILLFSLNILLVAGWMSFCYWCNWWQRAEPPAFHASWSRQQRADLLEIDNAMRYSAIFNTMAAIAAEADAPSVEERALYNLSASWLIWRGRRFAKPARWALHEAISTGRGDVYTESGIPVAYFALRLHKMELVKALVERGCNPNAPYISWSAAESIDKPGTLAVSNLLVDSLTGEYFEMTGYLSPATRLELLNFLEQHGADTKQIPNARDAALNALLPCLGSDPDGGVTYAWLLTHGLELDENSLHSHAKLLQDAGASTTLKNLRSKGLLPPPTEQSEQNCQ